jgi:hypothetical protein
LLLEDSSNNNRHWRLQKGFEIRRVIVDDWKEPSKRVDNQPDNLDYFIQCFPVLANEHQMFFRQNIMQYFRYFDRLIFFNQNTEIVQLVGTVVLG